MAIFRMIHPSNGHHMPLFFNGPAILGISTGPEAATSIHPPGTPWPNKTEDTETVITMGYHGCCGVINWLYQVKNHVKNPVMSRYIHVIVSLGNFYNYLGFPKMECFDPTDITRPLGPSFSCRFWRAPAVLSLPSVMSTGTGKNHLQMIGNTWKYKKWLEKSWW